MTVRQMLTHSFPKGLGLYYLPEPDVQAALCSVKFVLVKNVCWIKTIAFIAEKKLILFEYDLCLSRFLKNHQQMVQCGTYSKLPVGVCKMMEE